MNRGRIIWHKVIGVAFTMVLITCLAVPMTGVLAESSATQQEAREGVGVEPTDSPEYVEGEVLVKFKHSTSPERATSAIKVLGAESINSYDRIGVQRLKLREGTKVEEAIAFLSKDESVEYAEPNYVYRTCDTYPNDPGFDELWGLDNRGQNGGTRDADIDAPGAWDITTGSSDVVVAVIDTGVDYTHEDLAANMWQNPGEIPGNGEDDDLNGHVDDIYGIDTCTYEGHIPDSDPMDDEGHGTHCAGTIGAVGDNGIGVVGVNWNVRLMALKFLDSTGYGNTTDAVAAIEYIIDMKENHGVKVKVISNSWGGLGYNQSLYNEIAAAGAADILFVAAAGNSGTDNDVSPFYPASHDLDCIIAVAATDHNDNLADEVFWASNYGVTSVDLGAPGVDILSTTPGDNYDSWSGTSMATPHVSGVAALVLATNPDYHCSDVKTTILDTVDPISGLAHKVLTGGRLNAKNFLFLSQVWVDDDWAGASPGDPVGDGHIFGTDAFARIQDGIDALESSGIVNVLAGQYMENITLASGVKVMGAGAQVTTIAGNPGHAVVTAVDVDSAATLDGFTITGGSEANIGGMYNKNSSLTVSNCIFWDNYGSASGGMYNYSSSPTVINCIFWDNHGSYAGGMCNVLSSSPHVANCTFSGNSATDFGGMYNFYSSPTVTNCIFWGDTGGWEIGDYSSSATVTYCDVQGGYPGESNMDRDPLFVDPGNGDFCLQFGSWCIDAGDDAAVPSDITNDLEGNPRFVDGDGYAGAVVDMGVNEHIEYVPYLLEVWVDDDWEGRSHGAPVGDGHTFGIDAFATIQDGINIAATSGTVHVAAGTYFERLTWRYKNLVIQGAGADITTILPDMEAPYSSVVECWGLDPSSKLDGFTLTSQELCYYGIDNFNSSLEVANCAFSGNGTILVGMHNFVGDNGTYQATVTNCAFEYHGSTGMDNGAYFGTLEAMVTNCTFSGHSHLSGALYNHASAFGRCEATVTNCTFSGNLYGMYNRDYFGTCEATVTNCTFSGNSYGMYNWEAASPIVTNCILWGNAVDEIYNEQGSSPVVTYCDVQGGYPGEGNIDQDPLLTADLHLQRGSPCIDAGDNDTPSLPETDFEGDPRIWPPPGTVDMGVDELVDEFLKVIYVDSSTTGSGNDNGTSWADAFDDLQEALTTASSSDTIWVASGTYYPDENAANPNGTGNRSATFRMVDGVALYGGFPSGGGTWEDRDPAIHVTTLSGDIDGDGVPDTQNAYTVVSSLNCYDTVIDGFTISGGYADKAPYVGGMYNKNSSLTVSNCIFSGNYGTAHGGMYNYSSSPMVINCIFWDNHGIYVGGMCNANGSSPRVTNCTFSGNPGVYVGAMYNINSSPVVTNCILWGNSGGSEIYNNGGSATFTYCDIRMTSGTYPGTGNINADPLFENPGGGDFHLELGSPCIDSGSNSAAAGISTDFEGDPRIIDGDGYGGAVVDRGADEYLP
ncbi:MAG: hypothetical protein A2Y72_06450 [Chloroflexi bacterium RBG_13_53_26]|nr:MAG: hypothetical protein A2Y72_06450 [Chloroflexi bacterium RBG_13_53_26]